MTETYHSVLTDPKQRKGMTFLMAKQIHTYADSAPFEFYIDRNDMIIYNVSKVLAEQLKQDVTLQQHWNAFSDNDQPLIIVDTYNEDLTGDQASVSRYTFGAVIKDKSGLHSMIETGQAFYPKESRQADFEDWKRDNSIKSEYGGYH